MKSKFEKILENMPDEIIIKVPQVGTIKECKEAMAKYEKCFKRGLITSEELEQISAGYNIRINQIRFARRYSAEYEY